MSCSWELPALSLKKDTVAWIILGSNSITRVGRGEHLCWVPTKRWCQDNPCQESLPRMGSPLPSEALHQAVYLGVQGGEWGRQNGAASLPTPWSIVVGILSLLCLPPHLISSLQAVNELPMPLPKRIKGGKKNMRQLGPKNSMCSWIILYLQHLKYRSCSFLFYGRSTPYSFLPGQSAEIFTMRSLWGVLSWAPSTFFFFMNLQCSPLFPSGVMCVTYEHLRLDSVLLRRCLRLEIMSLKWRGSAVLWFVMAQLMRSIGQNAHCPWWFRTRNSVISPLSPLGQTHLPWLLRMSLTQLGKGGFYLPHQVRASAITGDASSWAGNPDFPAYRETPQDSWDAFL